MPGNRRVTIRDVAIASGHAVSTVSNALAGKHYVKEETRRNVRDIAAKLGYRPSALAQSLRMQRSSTIGVLVSDVSNPALTEFIRGIDDIAVREGCTILLGNTDEILEKQVGQMRSLLDRQVDGMVLISQHSEQPEVRELLDGSTPYVLIQRRSPKFEDDYVGSNNLQGTETSLRYLYDLGHRRIGLITGPSGSSTAMERLDAFRKIIADLGCDIDAELIFRGDYTVGAGYNAMHYFARLGYPPTAIIASNDICALGVQDASIELGLNIPRDLSLFGSDNILLAGLRQINLTTLHLAKRRMGVAAAELLLDRIRGKRRDTPIEIIVESRLVERGSCAPPHKLMASAFAP